MPAYRPPPNSVCIIVAKLPFELPAEKTKNKAAACFRPSTPNRKRLAIGCATPTPDFQLPFERIAIPHHTPQIYSGPSTLEPDMHDAETRIGPNHSLSLPSQDCPNLLFSRVLAQAPD